MEFERTKFESELKRAGAEAREAVSPFCGVCIPEGSVQYMHSMNEGVRMYVCMYVYVRVYVHMYVHTYVCTCVYVNDERHHNVLQYICSALHIVVVICT